MISLSPSASNGPSPDENYPLPGIAPLVFLKNFIDHPQIVVGDYTFYAGTDGPRSFQKNVLFMEPGLDDRLIIGRFCVIADGVLFVMNGANQAMDRLSAYPFHLFGRGWEASAAERAREPHHGDTLIGHDVSLGVDCLIMPGVTIGDGAVVLPRSVVHNDVPPYAVVMGNPGLVQRMRFDPETIRRLLAVAWWHWPAEQITAALDAIRLGDVAQLESLNNVSNQSNRRR